MFSVLAIASAYFPLLADLELLTKRLEVAYFMLFKFRQQYNYKEKLNEKGY